MNIKDAITREIRVPTQKLIEYTNSQNIYFKRQSVTINLNLVRNI